jgi:hypothetical protein
MVDIHVQYTGGYVYGERWIHYLWGRLGQRAYMVEYPFAGGDAHSSIILHELMKRVSKKPQ